MSRKRYLFFDIDGTLAAGGYGNTYIPESTELALKKLREAGHFLCIATGRSQAMAVDYMHQLGFVNMVSDGGYGVTINDNLIGITPIDRDKVIRLIRECQSKDIPWGLQVNNSDTRFVPDGRFEEFTHDIYMKSQIVEELDPEWWQPVPAVSRRSRTGHHALCLGGKRRRPCCATTGMRQTYLIGKY